MEKLRFYRQTGMLDPTLNAMSRKGFTVKRTAFGFYLFSSCPPGEYTYQTVWTFGMKREERRQMIDRLSRSGIVPVSQRLFWICFRGKGFFNPYQNRMQKAEALGWQRSILFSRSLFFALTAAGTLNLGLQGSGWWLLGTVAAGVLCIWNLFSWENCRNRAKELTNRAFCIKIKTGMKGSE